MGVDTKIKLPSNVEATYHKIDGLSELKWDNEGRGQLILALSQYVDYQSRLEGACPVNKKYERFELDRDLTGIFLFTLYRAVLPLKADYSNSVPVQDGELGNMLRLLKYLTDAEMSVMIFALQDILALKEVDPEIYRDWYNKLKEDTLSVLQEE